MLVGGVINIRSFNVINKVCSLGSSGLDHSISLSPNFFTPDLGFRILGAQVGSTSFVELFVVEVLHEDFRMIFSLPMLVDPQMFFVMILLCYTQHRSYLLCTMFPSLGILQHYVKFNICTIITLEKLLDVGSFGGSIDHLAYC
jgi:hypothetical protein